MPPFSRTFDPALISSRKHSTKVPPSIFNHAHWNRCSLFGIVEDVAWFSIASTSSPNPKDDQLEAEASDEKTNLVTLPGPVRVSKVIAPIGHFLFNARSPLGIEMPEETLSRTRPMQDGGSQRGLSCQACQAKCAACRRACITRIKHNVTVIQRILNTYPEFNDLIVNENMRQVKPSHQLTSAVDAVPPNTMRTVYSAPGSMSVSNSTESLSFSVINDRPYSVATSSRSNASSTEDLLPYDNSSDSVSSHEVHGDQFGFHAAGLTPCHFPPIFESTEQSTRSHALVKVESFRFPIGSNQCANYLIAAVQTAWGVILQRYTLADEVCFGYVLPKRSTGNQGGKITALHSSTIFPCRIVFRDNASFAQLNEDLEEALRHNVDAHVDVLSYEHFSGLFNTIVLFEQVLTRSEDEHASDELPNGDLNVRPLTTIYSLLLRADKYKYDVLLNVRLEGLELIVSLFCSSSLLCSKAREQLSISLLKTLAAALNPKMHDSISKFQIIHTSDIDTESFSELLRPTKLCTHWVIAEQVRRQPERQALVTVKGSWSYQQLAALASQLSSKLINGGVRPKSYVGICLPKSALPIIAMLAVQVAGAAFVPLDPSAPPARWLSILAAANATTCITTPDLAGKIENGVRTVVIVGEEDLNISSGTTHKSVNWRSLPSSPHDPSFVIFTSGSTGTPKGIIMEHQAACSTSDGYARQLGVGTESRVFQFSSYTFDMGVLDVLVTLMRGGCICLPSEHERWNDLPGSMTRMEANMAFLTPTVAELFHPADVPHLKDLILAGEVVSQTLYDRWRTQVRLHGAYGPTETSVCALTDTPVRGKRNLIGKPCSSAFWVVDPKVPTRIVPDGCIGELLVQGPLLAREYISASSQSIQNWILESSLLPSGLPKAKAYRTGDLVRKCINGEFEYVGRKDSQVKLRGQRIELGEIEAQLSLHLPSDMRGFVDLLSGEKQSLDTIASFIWYVDGPHSKTMPPSLVSEFSKEEDTIIASVETNLKAILPSYMIPAVYFLIKGSPEQTHSGKIDRKQLSALGQKTTPAQRRYFVPHSSQLLEMPTGDMELKLRDLWAAILNLDPTIIRRTDSFFGLGGDSVAAIKLTSAAIQCDICLTAALIFSNPTLNSMAAEAKITAPHSSSISTQPFELIPAGLEKETALDLVQDQCHLSSVEMIEDIYPCSPFQEGLMAITARNPGFYVETISRQLKNKVDVAHFKTSWEKVTQLCDILKTRIVLTDDGDSLQAVVRSSVEWLLFDKMNSAVETLGNMEFGYGSKLNYCALVEHASGSVSFVWAAHHSLHDAWTLRNVFDLVEKIYVEESCFVQTEYSLFIKHLKNIDSEATASFWRQRLSDAEATPFPPLTYDFSANTPKLMTRSTINLPENVSKTTVTTASVVLAAWNLVLARYSDSDDVCFGVTVSGRQAAIPEAHQFIGPMVATVPFRAKINKESSISSYLQSIQCQSIEMTPFEQYGLQNISKLSPAAKEACQFSTLLVIQPSNIFSMETERMGSSLFFSSTNDDSQQDNDMQDAASFEYPLVLQALMHRESLDLTFTYDARYLAESQCFAISQQLAHVISQLVSCPNDLVRSVNLAGPWDLQQAVTWNGVETAESQACLHEMFAKVAEEKTDCEAIFTEEGSLSYAQLRTLSSVLTMHLISLQVPQSSIVPICFRSSKWAIVAMLGVLGAGCSFVALEPAHPEQRRRFLIEKVKAKVLVTAADVASLCEHGNQETVVLEDEFFRSHSVSKDEFERKPRDVKPSDLAYIIFTSGSTGVPKGVCVQHRAICTSISSYKRTYNVKSSMRAVQFSSYAFDASIYEVFMTLLCGGTVCVPAFANRLENLSSFMTEAQVSFAMLTPTFAKTLSPKALPALEDLMLIGEAPTLDVIDKWKNYVRLMNGYGPTECCVLSDIHTYKKDERRLKFSTVIGKSLHGKNWIVDPENHNQLAPVGCVGELIIQSPALASGYYGEDGKASIVFMNRTEFKGFDTASDSSRAYKTGDLVRYGFDGSIEYIGRKDTQIKLRGQRLELGEIEYRIFNSTSKVKHATVHLSCRSTGDILVAFVDLGLVYGEKPAVEDDFSDLMSLTNELRDELIRIKQNLEVSLPSYMVPAFLLPVLKMPFVTSMKVDRRSLQSLADCLPLQTLRRYSLVVKSDEKRPWNDTELLLRDIWAQVLHLDACQVDQHDSFLHIGGDSINAIQLTALARKRGIILSVASIFQHPVLREMAKVMKPLDSSEGSSDTTPLPFSLLKTKDLERKLGDIRYLCQMADSETIQDAYPCTPLQEGLLALSVKHPGSYIAKHVYRIGPQIDLDRFRKAWEHTYDICDNQRQRIVKLRQDSVQVVIDGDFMWENSGSMSLAQFLETCKDIKMSYGDKLTRSAIVQDPSSGERYFVWINHHAIFDGWTVSLVLTSFMEAYQGAEIAPIVPYSGFIRYSSSLNMRKARNYWKNQLRGGQPPNFPAHRSLSDLGSIKKKKVTNLVSRDMSFTISKKTHITKGTILRAAWAIVLARYGNTADVCFGATASGRNASVAGIERMAGAVIGTVPVRICLDESMPVSNFLGNVQRQALEMVPYEQTGLQNILKIDAETREVADFLSLLIVQPEQQVDAMANVAADIMTKPSDDEYSFVDTMEGYFTFPIVVQCHVYKETVTIEFTYDNTAVSGSQMTALCHHFEKVAQHLLKQDEEPLSQVGLTSSWDLQMSMEFNKNVENVCVDACIHELIADQARESPHKEALYTTSTSITYSKLDHLSSMLARSLIQHGIESEEIVPVCVEKSIWAPVAMLGIMKAGGAFMPMEPTHPLSRKEALAAQVNARLLVTSKTSFEANKEIVKKTLILSDEFFIELEQCDLPPLEQQPAPANAAYVLFTSGSTGNPKGISVEHTAVASSIISHGKKFGLGSSSRVLQFASYIFDVSVSEILATLVFGGTVCIPTVKERLQDITTFINRSNADIAMLTPSFVGTFRPGQVPRLKTVILGGEAPTKSILDIWQPHVRLLNGYAPAECCIYALTHTYKSLQDSPTLLGKGMHSYCWVVEPDNSDKLAPIGCTGELIIQSNCIGRGYVADSVKTAQAFIGCPSWVPDGFRKHNYRFYKSGDLVRYDENGELEYLGRKDTQVKLRGQRIELGEIECAIVDSFDDVNYAAVEVIRRKGRDTLIAFASFGSSDSRAEMENQNRHQSNFAGMTSVMRERFERIASSLRSRLPPYMVPSLFMPVKQMPFLSSMKVDRRSLRKLVDELPPEDLSTLTLSVAMKEAPITDMELKMREMWAEVLQTATTTIGRNDSFFQLGGDSIALVELVNLARSQNLSMTVVQMFKDPTLSAMAAFATSPPLVQPPSSHAIQHGQPDKGKNDACIQCGAQDMTEIEDIFPCTAMQEALLAVSLKQPGSYMSTLIYLLSPETDLERFKTAWEYTVRVCGNLRTRFIASSSTTSRQAVVKSIPAWGNTAGLSLKSYVNQPELREISYGSPLCRYAIVKDNKLFFAVSMHHAIYDLWTLQLVVRVLENAYNGLTSTVFPFKNFVKYISSQNSGSSKKYWRSQLHGAKRSFFPRPKSREHVGGVTRTTKAAITLPGHSRLNVTTATIIRAAWAILLAQYCETDDICFGTTVSGRLAPIEGLTDMPGPAITTIPVRLRLDKEQLISEFLSSVQNHSTEMIPHEQYGLRNIASLGAHEKDACELSSILLVQPVEQVSALMGEAEIMKEYDDEEMQQLSESQLQGYFDCPLIMNCLLSRGSIELIAYHDTAFLSDADIITLKHHMQNIIIQLLTRGENPLGSISVSGQRDIDLAVESQPRHSEQDAAITSILVNIKQYPSSIAVESWDGNLTYAELGSSATILAKMLSELQVGPQASTALYLGRSKLAIVALVATHMTGASSVSVDLDLSTTSIAGLLRGLNVQAILTTKAAEATVRGFGIPVVGVDDSTISAATGADFIPTEVYRSDTSHFVYSKPSSPSFKLIAVQNNAAALVAQKCVNLMGIKREMRVLHISEASNYLGMTELLIALISGACVCIPSDSRLKTDISEAVVASRANAAIVLPTVAERIRSNTATELQTLAVGGDIVHWRSIEAWIKNHGVDLFTFYGTNKSSVAAWQQVSKTKQTSLACIGRPLHSSMWVIDRNCEKITPLGSVGELFIENPCCDGAQSDDNVRVQLESSMKGAPNFAPSSGEAIKTGDIVRRNLDGSIELVAEKAQSQNSQFPTFDYTKVEVSLRGCLPLEMSGTVVHISDSSGAEASLVGLLWCEKDTLDRGEFLSVFYEDSDEINTLILNASTSLKASLPLYMLPTSYIVFQGSSTGPWGKKQRKREVLALAKQVPQEKRRYTHLIRKRKEPPSTKAETVIRDLWAATLSIPGHDIGKQDNFLHLGGNSVTAIQLVSLGRRHGIHLTVASIFRNPRLCDLATWTITNSQAEAAKEIKPFMLVERNDLNDVIEQVQLQCALDSRAVEDVYPCTALQEGLWALSIKSKGAYIVHYKFRFTKDVSVEKFLRAWERVVEVTEIMRTRIALVGNSNVQAVIKEPISWEYTEGESIAQYMSRCSQFTMEYGSRLNRYAIIAEEYFVWTVHHAVWDGWTMQLILDRLNRVYRGFQLPRMPPFVSFIKHTLNANVDASVEFWKQELHAFKQVEFPAGATEKTRATSTSSQTFRFNVNKNDEITAAVIMRTAWAIMVTHYCETDDICFGTTVSGRQASLDDLNDIAGPTIATVPCRIKLSKDLKIGNLLRQVQEQSLNMVAHEQYGLQNIAKVTAPASQEACAFSNLFTVQPRQFSPISNTNNVLLDDNSPDDEDVPASEGSYFTLPLVAIANLLDSSVCLDISYCPELLSELRIQAMMAHFENIVHQLMQSRGKSVGEITVAGSWDLQNALSWNMENLTPTEVCIHDLFTKQVAEIPLKEAIYSTELSLTYAELDNITTQLAAYLRQLGVGPESIVPYCFEKSAWAVISVMAILKAGGAFMPLDQSHPRDYREKVVEQVHAQVMLVSPITASACKGLTAHVIEVSPSLECFSPHMDKTHSSLSLLPAQPQNPVYVIFSSGSTGTPKGIVLEHRAYAASLRGQCKKFGISRNSRFLQFSNHVFDVSCMEILSTLSMGGTVCVPTETERLQHTAQFMEESRCNIALITPSFLRSLDPSQVPSLETLLVGGEALPDDVVQTWAGKLSLFNAYGPAEVSVVSAVHEYKHADEPSSLIGGPLSNAAWVVDPSNPDRLAAISCIGELVLQGPAIARGYVNDPERCQASFVSDVACLPRDIVKQCPRFYRTGDLVYYHSSGTMRFVGRKDTQVKLRGQRMELGDIETKILRIEPTIQHVIVDVVRQTSFEALVAFIGSKPDSTSKGAGDSQRLFCTDTEATRLLSERIARELSGMLPSYMVPSYFLPVSDMPYTSTGKIDRRVLRECAEGLAKGNLAAYSVSRRVTFRQCANETETRIRALWAKSLGQSEETIGADDNFYDLGGDSIRIVTLVKHLKAEFQFHLSLSMMNSRNTTIGVMAKMVHGMAPGTAIQPTASLDLRAEITSALESITLHQIHQHDSQAIKALSSDSVTFLTGATGFLGTQILRQLLSSADIGCVVVLVRCSSAEDGLERLKRSAKICKWWYEEAAYRIEVWPGDLCDPQLGLGTENWSRLCGRSASGNINAIIHNGAVVNWTADYNKLYMPNVQSVLTLLDACVRSPCAPKFTYISGGSSTNPGAQDQSDIARELEESIGYNQTKFVAESIVYELASLLPPGEIRFSIVKPGLIIGTAAEGVANVDDFIWRVVATAARLRQYPLETGDGWLPLTDAAFVASQIVRSLLDDNAPAFNDLGSTCGLSSDEFWGAVNAELGSICTPTTWSQWIERAFEDMNDAGEEHPLWPVQHFLSDEGIASSTKLRVPDADELHSAIKKNVQYLLSVGFLQATKGQRLQLSAEVMRRS